jgi:predicted DNA-binding transcriptional regulator AlpA
MPYQTIKNESLLPSKQVRLRCGNVSPMTWWRWSQNEELGLPQSIKIGNRNYWKESEIEAWIASRH